MDDLTAFAATHWYLLIGLFFMVGLIIWLVSRNVTKENIEAKRTFWSYFFIWPLLLTRKEGEKSVQRGLTRREWIGWLVVAAIVVAAILLTPSNARAAGNGSPPVVWIGHWESVTNYF
jgi:uncharacterized membrane protein